ncbi:hypothetical protein ABIF91_000619 [Bradyrhizobium sp. USDA 241]
MITAVDCAAEITGDQAERDAERAGEDHAGDADGERDAHAIENGREHVAALLVGAEQERALTVGGPQRRDPRIHQLQLRRIERILHRKHGCKDREQEEQDCDGRRHHGELGTPERIKEIAVERAPEPVLGGM